MSFIQSTIMCRKCLYEMNIATGTFGFGIPKECPKCGGADYETISQGWNAKKEGDKKRANLDEFFAGAERAGEILEKKDKDTQGLAFQEGRAQALDEAIAEVQKIRYANESNGRYNACEEIMAVLLSLKTHQQHTP